VAARLGFKHYVLDYESRFRQQVMDDFADSYLRGETPIPCVRCNQTVKFTDLLATARDLGADCLATGHYVRRAIEEGRSVLRRGANTDKDQSYFLFATTSEQLDFLRFPLGGMNKSETREHARRFGLSIADKPDSQDICFVPDGRYGDVVRRLRPGAVEPGEIVYHDGTVLGQHDGVIDYTIGQRKGLGIGGIKGLDDSEGPLYVIGINPEKHQVVVGKHEMLACDTVLINEVNWLGTDTPKTGQCVHARLRSTAPAMPARITCWPPMAESAHEGDSDSGGTAEITLDVPQYGIAAGQAAALYDDRDPDRLLGGGWITSAYHQG
jgi:tRNA-specific 2-thiouridylase